MLRLFSVLVLWACPSVADRGTVLYSIAPDELAIMYGFSFYQGGAVTAQFEAVSSSVPVQVAICTLDETAKIPSCAEFGQTNLTDYCSSAGSLKREGDQIRFQWGSTPETTLVFIAATCQLSTAADVQLSIDATNPGGSQLSVGQEEVLSTISITLVVWCVLLTTGIVWSSVSATPWQICARSSPMASSWFAVVLIQAASALCTTIDLVWQRSSGGNLLLPSVAASIMRASADGCLFATVLALCLGFGVHRSSLTRDERQTLLFAAVCLAAVELTGSTGGGTVSSLLTVAVLGLVSFRGLEFTRYTVRAIAFIADAMVIAATGSPGDRQQTLRTGAFWAAAGAAVRTVAKWRVIVTTGAALWSCSAVLAAWPPVANTVTGDPWWFSWATRQTTALVLCGLLLREIVWSSALMLVLIHRQTAVARQSARAARYQALPGCCWSLPLCVQRSALALGACCSGPCNALCAQCRQTARYEALAPDTGATGSTSLVQAEDSVGSRRRRTGRQDRASEASAKEPRRAKPQPAHAFVMRPALHGAALRLTSWGMGVQPRDSSEGDRPSGSGDPVRAAIADSEYEAREAAGGLPSAEQRGAGAVVDDGALLAAMGIRADAPADSRRVLGGVARTIVRMAGPGNPLLASPGGVVLTRMAAFAPPEERVSPGREAHPARAEPAAPGSQETRVAPSLLAAARRLAPHPGLAAMG
jgi:hypothetical protein